MRKFFFYILCLLLLPIMMIGVAAYMIPIIISRGVVSGTTYEPHGARLLYDQMGLREDSAASKIAFGLPATNWVYRWFILHPLIGVCKLTSYLPVSFAYPASDPSMFTSPEISV